MKGSKYDCTNLKLNELVYIGQWDENVWRILGWEKVNLIFETQENGFINSKIFKEGYETFLFPEMEETRIGNEYEDPVVLMLDGST
jgi:hypothetical protein